MDENQMLICVYLVMNFDCMYANNNSNPGFRNIYSVTCQIKNNQY